MRSWKAEKVLLFMIETLLLYIDELKDFQYREGEMYQYGERVAYTECLEWIQFWEKAPEYGLAFNIEQKYPL